MRVLVYEWCCATTARGESPRAASLWTEGWAMLSAAVEDFRRVAGVEVITVLNEGLNEPAAFRAAAAEADYALVIAPEFDRILETRCRWAVEAGATLLGPSPESVALTADKLALARHFERCGAPTPETVAARDYSLPNYPTPFVVKLRYGAGSQEMLVCTDPATASDVAYEAGGVGEFVLQPLIIGLPASVSFLIGGGRTYVLPPAEQFVSMAGNFRYLGGRSPLPQPLADRAVRIARQAIGCVLGLNGYVGADVILGSAPNGSHDFAIEINPRLTTSYVGLRALTNDNLMEILLRLVRGQSVSGPRWLSGNVSWTPDGSTDLAAT